MRSPRATYSARQSRTFRACVVPLLALLLQQTACVSIGSTISERDPSELGPYPDEYREIVRLWIEDNLRGITEIDSLHVSEPSPGFADSVLMPRRYGWWTRVAFYARDGLGLSKGRISYALLIRSAKVIAQQKLLD
jgi:hypothetical protein